ncbi:MAG: hypothetical protein SVY10_15285 [Thermodesulfobacteriota bacterium]|nr:hypothetical protein [Thermodesulfobacteriota bacterium]
MELSEEKYQPIKYEIAIVLYGNDNTSGLKRFQKQLDRAVAREKLILQRKKQKALEYIPCAKKGNKTAIEWLKRELSLHVYTPEEIEKIRPYLTPPEPEPRPFVLNFRRENNE